MNFTILRFDSLESTNTEAINQAKLGADEGLCIVAGEQTAGRGRHSRTWVSIKDAGLYFSVILRPKLEARFLPLITLMTGVAVADTLSEFGIDSDIKWVNDILVNERKLCGILAETVETTSGLAVIVGIGINLKPLSSSPEIIEGATSLDEEIGPVDPEDVLTTLTSYLKYFYEMLSSEGAPSAVIREWQRRSSYFIRKSVKAIVGNETIIGVTDGLEENGALRVRTGDGRLKIIQSGDVEKLRTTDC
jgi:BirA family biotin operon repressor/biotin-[acetyl-CoA-carboxylase] ligase